MTNQTEVCSSFQRRPAYRYIRATDKLPGLGQGGDDPIAKIRLFNPTGVGTWYVAEFDPERMEAFGYVDLHEGELGYFSIVELVQFRGRFGLPIERDLHYTPKRLSEVRGD